SSLHRDGARRRLPVPRRQTCWVETEPTMRRAVAISVVACALGAGIVAVALDLSGALLTLELLLAVSLAALAAGFGAQRSRRRIGSLSHQLALAVGIAVGAILAAVGVAAAVMFISGEDALLVSVMSVVIAVVGVCVARLLTEPMIHDLERVRDRLSAVGAGKSERGPGQGRRPARRWWRARPPI